MIDQQILEVLQKAITAAVADDPIPVKYVGITFQIPSDQKWLEVVFLPNNDTGAYWGEESNARGSLRLLLHWPVDGRGAYPPMRRLEAVSAYFSKGRWLEGVQITDPPNLTGAIEAGAEMIYPCTVRYCRFAAA